jgi:hypothetical protein
MNPLLTEALVAPRQDDLRRSARRARGVALRSRSAAPAAPLPAWAVAVRPTPVPALVAEPCRDC